MNSSQHHVSTRHTAARPFAASRVLLASAGLAFVTACGGSDSPTAPAPAHALRLTNNSLRTVSQVFYAPCADTTWGDDKLSGSIAPAGVKIFAVASPGCYDVRVVATDGHSWRRDDIDIQGTVGIKVE